MFAIQQQIVFYLIAKQMNSRHLLQFISSVIVDCNLMQNPMPNKGQKFAKQHPKTTDLVLIVDESSLEVYNHTAGIEGLRYGVNRIKRASTVRYLFGLLFGQLVKMVTIL